MIFNLLRAKQWYKNLVVFLAIFFSGNIFDIPMLITSLIAFISLCLVSSSNYIINDIIDRKIDRKNPEKKHRPIAAGKIKPYKAAIFAFALLIISSIIALYISFKFLTVIIFLFIFTLLYTFFLKKIPFIDVTSIGVNFIARAVSGAIAINVWISPFLILVPFFISIFLSAGKRYSETIFLKKSIYSKKALKPLIFLSFALIIISFIIYCIVTDYYFLITLPVVFYILFYYNKQIISAKKLARHPELLLINKKFLFITLFFSALLFLIKYRSIFF